MKVIVTGGAGFIGSALIRKLAARVNVSILNIDLLTYAANLKALADVQKSPNYDFLQADICDIHAIRPAVLEFEPDVIVHLAAESHVDRSISGPYAFVNTNIVGTFTLLEVVREYRDTSGKNVRFHHVSTDEVFGDLPHPSDDPANQTVLFSEQTPYEPSSPYSASKAASDHLVRAWGRTYGLDYVVTNCSNNYGPHQFPEKLIPLVIKKALAGATIPVYGAGDQIRDWLYVEDHAVALIEVLTRGVSGETYVIGGHNEQTNLDVVKLICQILDRKYPKSTPYSDQIEFVADRPGHDRRYAIDAAKIKSDLGWVPQETFESGIEKTVDWYLRNRELLFNT